MLAGNIWVKLRLDSKRMRSDLKTTTASIKSSFRTIGIGLTASLGMLARTGLKQASDFAENWSVVTNAVSKDIQDKIMDSFSSLKRTSKAEFADIAATITGTLKSKGVSDEVVGTIAPEVIKRLEDTGAFYNKTSEEVLHAFTSMISGMARPMEMLTKGAVVPLVANLDRLSEEKFGIRFEQLAPDQQTLLRLQFFLEGTAKVPFLINNSANTIGTYKGSVDSMKKSINDASQMFAKTLVPQLVKLMPMLVRLTELAGKFSGVITTLGVAFATFRLGKFVGEMVKAISLLLALSAAKTLSKTTLLAIPLVGGLVGGAIGLIASITSMGGVSFSGAGSSASMPQQAETTINITTTDENLRVNSPTSGNINPFGRGGD